MIADPVTTAMAVFDAVPQRSSSTVIELTDGARVPVLDAMSRTLFLSLDRRDRRSTTCTRSRRRCRRRTPQAASVRAKAAQDEEAVTFDAHDARRCRCGSTTSSSTSTACCPTRPTCVPAARRILTQARAQIVAHRGRRSTRSGPRSSRTSPPGDPRQVVLPPQLPTSPLASGRLPRPSGVGAAAADRALRSHERELAVVPRRPTALCFAACSLPRRSSPATSR